jgi:hypothetical protein
MPQHRKAAVSVTVIAMAIPYWGCVIPSQENAYVRITHRARTVNDVCLAIMEIPRKSYQILFLFKPRNGGEKKNSML